MAYTSLEELWLYAGKEFRELNAEIFKNIQKPSEKQKDKPSKHRNIKTTIDGVTYDSIKEANRWFELQRMERVGMIQYLQRQVPFEVKEGYVLNGKKVRPIMMVLDAIYMRDGIWIAEDVKPSEKFITRDWLNKAKLFRDLYREWTLEIYI